VARGPAEQQDRDEPETTLLTSTHPVGLRF